MDYSPEIQQAMRDVKQFQRDRSSAMLKEVRIGAALCSVRRYLDDDAFATWVEGDLGIPLHLAQQFMEMAFSITPEPIRCEWMTPTAPTPTSAHPHITGENPRLASEKKRKSAGERRDRTQK